MDEERVLSLMCWDPYEERDLSPASEEVLAEAIRTLSDKHSATIAIGLGGVAAEETDRWLAVYANDGRFSVTAQLGLDAAYNLVGDPTARGITEFLLGGQASDWPRQFLVSPEQALAAALHFFRTGTVDLESGCWDRQGPGDAREREGLRVR